MQSSALKGAEGYLALKRDRTVVAWGNNHYGQCDVPAGLSGVIAISAGGGLFATSHSMALKADGTVVAWGDNSYGKRDLPNGLSGVVDIDAGVYMSMALFGVVNTPPLAASYALGTPQNEAGHLPLFKLHRACSDPDWDTFIITGVAGSTAAGGTAQLAGNEIVYTPPFNFVGADSFSYRVQDRRGGVAQGTIQVTVTDSGANGPNILVTVASNGAATIFCAGIPGEVYSLEVSANLQNWNFLQSATAGPNGLFQFTDSEAGNHTTRFYRTRHSP